MSWLLILLMSYQLTYYSATCSTPSLYPPFASYPVRQGTLLALLANMLSLPRLTKDPWASVADTLSLPFSGSNQRTKAHAMCLCPDAQGRFQTGGELQSPLKPWPLFWKVCRATSSVADRWCWRLYIEGTLEPCASFPTLCVWMRRQGFPQNVHFWWVGH